MEVLKFVMFVLNFLMYPGDHPSDNEEYEVDEEQEEASNNRKRKARGPTFMPELIKNRSEGLKLVLRFNNKGQPIGDAYTKFASLLGNLARTKVPIIYDTWKQVPSHYKDTIWITVKMSFDVEDGMKKTTISSTGAKWRQFKSVLYKKHISPFKYNKERLKKPPAKYSILQGHWDKFVKTRMSEEFQRVSENAKKSQANSTFRHRLSRKGYARLEAELQRELGSNDDIDRSILWIEAQKDKNGEYDSVDLKKYAARIEELNQQVSERKLSINASLDVLTMVLETPEHSGRLRGVGHYVTPTSYFGRHQSKKAQNGPLKVQVEYLKDEVKILTSLLEDREKNHESNISQQNSKTKESMASCVAAVDDPLLENERPILTSRAIRRLFSLLL